MFVACGHPFLFSLHIVIKLDLKDRGTALSIGMSDGPRAHSLASMCMRASAPPFTGMSLLTGVVTSVALCVVYLCVVCTAPCLVELDLISGPRSDPICHIHLDTEKDRIGICDTLIYR
jgi:hypothetical protein